MCARLFACAVRDGVQPTRTCVCARGEGVVVLRKARRAENRAVANTRACVKQHSQSSIPQPPFPLPRTTTNSQIMHVPLITVLITFQEQPQPSLPQRHPYESQDAARHEHGRAQAGP
eukprot:5058391-Pleurochrysis_carterae.AAC.1